MLRGPQHQVDGVVEGGRRGKRLDGADHGGADGQVVIAVAEGDVLRLCGGEQSTQRPGVRALRFLEAAAPRGGRLVFDEWHQGFGRQPERVGAVSYALGRTGWGRGVGVLVLALTVKKLVS